MSSFPHPYSVPTDSNVSLAGIRFELDPELLTTMSAQDIADLQAPHKTNLDLLVNAMETSDRPKGQYPPGPSSAGGISSPKGVGAQRNQQNPPPGDTRMRSLLQASMAVSPPNSYPGTPLSAADRPGKTGSEKHGKRKRADGPSDEQASEASRRRTQDLPRPRPGDIPATSMTHVTCLHAAVAQKSYGHEKRFLCPPPLVRVHTPIVAIKEQQFTMSVVTEDGLSLAQQPSNMDSIMQFKYLHVGGASTKSKSFHLTLELAAPTSATPGSPSSYRKWASFESGAVTIISKPSKKTAKTRNVSTCIMDGSSISLFNRINSQTVRTKYMTVDRAELAASNMSWSAFRIQILDDENGNPISPIAPGPSRGIGGGVGGMYLAPSIAAPVNSGIPQRVPRPIHYGARVVLTDEVTGISSEPLIVRKVDKGKLTKVEDGDSGGLVSQMQKIALQRASSNSDVPEVPQGLYLSAGRLPLPAHSADRSNLAGHSAQDGKAGSTSHPLTYQAPRGSNTNTVTNADEVDDFLCWTIVGIAEYQYTFFDASTVHPPLSVPPRAITPFPIAVVPPQYQLGVHRVEMQVLHFFPTDPRTQTPVGMEVWIGNLGPLAVHTMFPGAPAPPLQPIFAGNGAYESGPSLNFAQHQYQSNVAGPVNPQMPGANGMPQQLLGEGHPPAGLEDNGVPLPATGRHTSLDPPGTRRTTEAVVTISVEMPPMTTILNAIRDLTNSANNSDASSSSGTYYATSNGSVPIGPGGRPALPIIFVRPFDLVGYMTGYAVACENVFNGGMGDPGLTGAQGWTLRVV